MGSERLIPFPFHMLPDGNRAFTVAPIDVDHIFASEELLALALSGTNLLINPGHGAQLWQAIGLRGREDIVLVEGEGQQFFPTVKRMAEHLFNNTGDREEMLTILTTQIRSLKLQTAILGQSCERNPDKFKEKYNKHAALLNAQTRAYHTLLGLLQNNPEFEKLESFQDLKTVADFVDQPKTLNG